MSIGHIGLSRSTIAPWASFDLTELLLPIAHCPDLGLAMKEHLDQDLGCMFFSYISYVEGKS